MQNMKNLLTFCLMVCCVAVQAQLVTYPEGLQTGMPHNDDYTVRVRVPGGDWKDLFEYNVQVDMDRVQDASMVQFDMGSPVEVMVKKNNGMIHEVDIRPQARKVQYVQNKNVITFTLDKPQYLSVEFNGDRLHNLHLFANPMETETYSEEEKGVMYFGPGVHRPKDLPNNQIRIPGNTTVYLAPGAVVKAKLLLDKVENVRIIGRGILDHPVRGIEITDSKNIVIDGITVVNPDHYTVFGGGDIAGTVDFIIHDDHDAFTFCFRRRSNANSFKKVHRTVGRNGCGRAHSADQNHRLVALSNKVQEVSGFFQCIGTVGNHHSVNLRISQQFVNALGKFQQGLGIHIVGRDLDDLFTGNIGIVFHCGNRFDQSLNA